MSQGDVSDAFLQQVFRKVDSDGSGSISANELQSALSNGTWSPFNPETVRMMIGMFDNDNSSTIDFGEFKSLWNFITQWEKLFRSFDSDKSGSIDKNEFRNALTSFVDRFEEDFSARLFHLGMFDHDGSSTIDFKEFRELWRYVSEWEKCFRRFDLDGSGSIDKHELRTALSSFGYRLSDRFYDLLIKKFDRTGRGTVAFDDFIQACVSIHTLTNAFRQFDHAQNGQITIGYEEFLHLVFSLKM